MSDLHADKGPSPFFSWVSRVGFFPPVSRPVPYKAQSSSYQFEGKAFYQPFLLAPPPLCPFSLRVRSTPSVLKRANENFFFRSSSMVESPSPPRHRPLPLCPDPLAPPDGYGFVFSEEWTLATCGFPFVSTLFRVFSLFFFVDAGNRFGTSWVTSS